MYGESSNFVILFFQIYNVDAGYTTTDDFTETRVTIKTLRPRQVSVK